MVASTSALSKFIKSYSGDYDYPTLVRHQGTVIAFAMRDDRRIVYSVLNLNAQKPSSLDTDFWPEQPEVLEFPKEIAEVGYGLADQYELPSISQSEEEEEQFLSTTARLTAKAPFEVMSDGRYVYVFRQAIAATHASNLLIPKRGNRLLSQDSAELAVTNANDQPVTVVNSTLLVDRFILSGATISDSDAATDGSGPQLKLKREVRFQRSRSKTRPQSTKDSLGALDMEEEPFLEPTREFSAIRLLREDFSEENFSEGRFAVLLLPTSVPEILRWQIFAYNPDTEMIDAYNVERSLDGFFNTRGSQTTTTGGSAETALTLQRHVDQEHDDYVELAWSATADQSDPSAPAIRSLETWIWPALVPQEPNTELALALIGGGEQSAGAPLSVWVVNNRQVRVGYGDGTAFHLFLSGDVLRSHAWNHVAVVLTPTDTGRWTAHLYINGLPKTVEPASAEVPGAPVAAPITQIGAPTHGFVGRIDEIRLWSRERSEREIRRDRHLRLTGQEPGLLAYWRLDAGSGTAIFDQVGRYYSPGTIHAGHTVWIDSDAPIGENAGIRRDSFQFAGRTITTGMTALLYYQQEETPTGYDQQAKPMKRGARVMLVVGTRAEAAAQSSSRAHIAVLDFGVSHMGRLAQIPDNVVLKRIAVENAGQPIDVSQTLNRIKQFQEATAQLQQQQVLLAEEIDDLQKVYERLENAIAQTSPVLYSIPTENTNSATLNPQLQDLQRYREALNNAQGRIDDLNAAINDSRITVYKHAGYSGHSATFKSSAGFNELKSNGVHDNISSIKLPEYKVDDQTFHLMEVTAYEHVWWRGKRETFRESTGYVGDKLNDKISELVIEEHPAAIAYRHEQQGLLNEANNNIDSLLGTLRNTRDRLLTTKNQKQAELDNLAQILNNTQRQQDAAQTILDQGVTASMATLHTDSRGLSIIGGWLDFAWTEDTPRLFDSAIGNIALYFRGTNDQFFVTYYRTLTQRAEYPLRGALSETIVQGLARSTEPEMDRLQIDIAPSEPLFAEGDVEAATSATCRVTIQLPLADDADPSRPAVVETWAQVPRNSAALARVLNGQSGDRRFVGRATYGRSLTTGDQLQFKDEGVQQSLPQGATLFVGDFKVTLRQSVDRGATILPITSDVANPPRTQLPIFYLPYDYARHAHTTQAGADLSHGSRLLAFVAAPDPAAVTDQTVTSGITLTSQWLAAAPGHTLTFDGDQAQATFAPDETDTLSLSQFAPTQDMTLEAWVRPNQIDPRSQRLRVLSYQPEAENQTPYFLELQAVENIAAIELKQSSTVARVTIKQEPGNESPLRLEGPMTLEAWIKPAPDESHGNILVQGGTNSATNIFLRLSGDHYEVGVQAQGADHMLSVPIEPGDRNELTWIHLAGVGEPKLDEETRELKYQWRLYRNGQQLGESALLAVGPEASDEDWAIGAYSDYTNAPRTTYRSFKGIIAEPRIWQRARTDLDISADLNREVSGYETDLVGCWRFNADNELKDVAYPDREAVMAGDVESAASPIPAYRAMIGMGQQVLNSATLFSGGNWNHLAAVYIQAYGVQLDGDDDTYLDAGTAETLNINGDLTLEVAFKAENLADRSQAMGLLTKGIISASEDPDQYAPYALFIYPSGRLGFIFEDVRGGKHLFISDASVPDLDKYHRVAVTRKRITNVLEGGDVEVYDSIQFYIDGELKQTLTYREKSKSAGTAQQPTDIGRSNQPLVFGRGGFRVGKFDPNQGHQSSINELYINDSARAEVLRDHIFEGRQFKNPADAVKLALANDQAVDESRIDDRGPERAAEKTFEQGITIAPFKGVISEIRIWNTALAESNLPTVIKGSQQGLVGWWQFTEGEGTETYDSSAGSNHASLKPGVEWIEDPDPEGSTVLLYHNGTLQRLEAVSESSDYWSSDAQFTLGGVQDKGLKAPFQGDLEEIRLWRTVRTQEQIQDHMFRRLKGEKEHFLGRPEDLLAYYPFDAETEGSLSDHSLQGLHLTTTGTAYVLSGAPIGQDTPQIRSALAGLRTPFNRRIDSPPAVQEYGDLQSDYAGNLIGAFKRCYSFIVDGEWQLITGFKVGDLVTEWVGQVQFDPQIIGYIEGAPPVPGENLTGTGVVRGEFADYNGASSVTLTEAENVTYTFSADRDRGFDFSFESSLANFGGAKVNAGGLFFEKEIVDVEQSIQLKSQFETSLSWLDSASRSDTLSTTIASSQQLQGYVEPINLIAYPDVGRRFVAENIGFALVESRTADVFALRLEHNQALVSYQMRPNPEIPPDRNIINFPLNPIYTKQGTLDGKIAFNADPDYPHALSYSNDSSFYKPREAYALKEEIQRSAERLSADYELYDAAAVGRRQNTLYGQAGDIGRKGAELEAELPNLAKRNLVNTYVWTADGGLFAETQETLDVVQETSGGAYSFKGLGGLAVDFKFELFGVGANFQAEALFGGHLNVQATKSIESETGFSLEVSVDGVERDIYLRDAAGDVLFDASDPLRLKALRHPGRVDAYRFMSFYLEPKPDHFTHFFETVVDPIWLEQSTEADAIALRSLWNQHKDSDKQPSCWRIMHRVTFVSRVLPQIDSQKPLPALESDMQKLNIDSNYELIKRLDPFVADKVDDYGAFSRAMQDAIKTYLPELQPHIPRITAFMLDYYGVPEVLQVPDSAQLAELLEAGERPPNQAPIVRAGNSQTVVLEGDTRSITLRGAVADDRLAPEAIFVTWEVTQAPDGATYLLADRHQLKTTLTVDRIGTYELALTASDGELSASDRLTILVNQEPRITAGPDQEIGFRETVNLQGQLLRDGRGDRAGQVLTTRWEKISGPGTVTFGNAAALSTPVQFGQSGIYRLELIAETETVHGTLVDSDDMQVVVGGRIDRGLLGLYSFAEPSGDQVRDVSDQGEPLPLAIVGPAQRVSLGDREHPDALRLVDGAHLVGASAQALTTAMVATQEFTLEAWLQPTTEEHPGLARILSLSAGPQERNFVLGQVGNQVYVAVRTHQTNANGSDRAFSGGTITANTLTHVVCTRTADGLTTLYIDGERVAQRPILGDFRTWDTTFPLILGNEGNGATSRDRSWDGTFHLLALYRQALSAAEVLTNFEVGADANLAPRISAGDNQVINLPIGYIADPATIPIKLVGRVTDDRLLSPRSVQWRQLSNRLAIVTFDPVDSLETNITFEPPGSVDPQGNPITVSGIYILQLNVEDEIQAITDEVQITVNHAPLITLASRLKAQVSEPLALNPQVESGLATPEQEQLSFLWEQLPTNDSGIATFSNPRALNSHVRFSEYGMYTLRFTVDNGIFVNTAEVTVYADTSPNIQVSSPPLINLPDTAELRGELLSTGLALPEGMVTVTWSQVTGPEPVIFGDPHALTTTAAFSTSGRYTLRLTADNGIFTTSEDITLVANQPPLVAIGPDRTVDFAEVVELEGIVSDDGLPNPPGRLQLRWSQLSGPGTVNFAAPESSYTTAELSLPGNYTLRLTADDGAATTASDLNIKVNVAPRVTHGLQVFYPFNPGVGQLRDLAGIEPALDLTLEQGQITSLTNDQGIALTEPGLIATPSAATRLSRELKGKSAHTIEVWITPSQSSPSSVLPARILTLSASSALRNFTLGQNNNQYVLRLRTSSNGLNGTDTVLAGGTVAENALTHLVCTHDSEGTAKLYLNGQLQASTVIEGNYSNWDESYRLALGDELTDGRRSWLGRYHLIAIYNRALSEKEILRNFVYGHN